MARLGSVLGAILAELTRSRVAADELSRQLVSEYVEDPLLASMSVPRIVVDEAAITLRFAVSELQEAPERPVNPEALRRAWLLHARRVLPSVLVHLDVPPDERQAVWAAVTGAAGSAVGEPPLRDVRAAVAGDTAGLAAATARPMVDAWQPLPRDIRSLLRGKAAFRRELERGMRDEFQVLLRRERELEGARAALASRVEVAVRPDELPDDPALVQEFRITVSGQDVDVLVKETEGLDGVG